MNRESATPDDELRWPLPNVWLGTSVENQEMANERIPELSKTPAAVRFLSLEPLIGPVNLHEPLGPLYPWLDWVCIGCESGPNRRPCKLDWVKSLIDQCDEASVPVFVKQLSAYRCECGRVHVAGTDPGTTAWGGVCAKCGLHETRMTPFVSKDPADWPEWARRREFPEQKERG